MVAVPNEPPDARDAGDGSDPTADEIRARAVAIRQFWNNALLLRRSKTPTTAAWLPPGVDASQIADRSQRADEN